MKKAVKVTYPKRKPRLKLEDLADVSEPDRESMYHVLLENLKIANRATFLHRIIYVGEHFFILFEDAKEVFEGVIIKANETYCIEKLTGFFLYYSNYFVHMVEGDEDNLNKHLGYLLDKNTKYRNQLGETKMLIHVSHINQRFFETWESYTAVPPKLLEKLDASTDFLQSGRYIYNCIKKIYSLIGNYADDLNAAAAATAAAATAERIPKKSLELSIFSSDESVDQERDRAFASFSYVTSSVSQDRASEPSGSKDYKLFLPEYELLDFILRSNTTMRLEEYFGLYGVVPMRDIYKDRVWPVPHDFIPYDVFEKPYDLITELPKESRRKRSPGGTPLSPGGTPLTSRVNLMEGTRSSTRRESRAIGAASDSKLNFDGDSKTAL